jgi:hypothetical protein
VVDQLKDCTLAVHEHEELPAGEVLDTGHTVHGIDPATFLYFPASHAVHVPPLAPVYPALQTHAVRAVLLVGEVLEPGQLVQVPVPVAVL